MISLSVLLVLLIIARLALGRRYGEAQKRVIDHKEFEGESGLFLNGIKAGNAQEIGEMEFQSSYFSIVQLRATYHTERHAGKYMHSGQETLSVMNPVLAVVAEGLKDDQTGRASAVIAVNVLRHSFESGLYNAFDVEDFYHDSFRKIGRAMRENIGSNVLGVRLTAVIIDGGVLNYAAIGNCVLVVLRNSELIHLTNIKELRISKFILNPGDVVMLASRGAFESLTEMEIIWYLGLDDHPIEKSQLLLKRAREKRIQLKNWAVVILEQIPTAPRQTAREWART